MASFEEKQIDVFAPTAHDETEQIGAGTRERMLVDQRVQQRLDAKRAMTGGP